MNKKVILILLHFLSLMFLFAENKSLNYQFQNINHVKITYISNPVLGTETKEFILSKPRDLKIFLSFFNSSIESESSTLVSMIEGKYEIEIFNNDNSEYKYIIISGGNYLKDSSTEKIYKNDRIYFYIQQLIYGDKIKKLRE